MVLEAARGLGQSAPALAILPHSPELRVLFRVSWAVVILVRVVPWVAVVGVVRRLVWIPAVSTGCGQYRLLSIIPYIVILNLAAGWSRLIRFLHGSSPRIGRLDLPIGQGFLGAAFATKLRLVLVGVNPRQEVLPRSCSVLESGLRPPLAPAAVMSYNRPSRGRLSAWSGSGVLLWCAPDGRGGGRARPEKLADFADDFADFALRRSPPGRRKAGAPATAQPGIGYHPGGRHVF